MKYFIPLLLLCSNTMWAQMMPIRKQNQWGYINNQGQIVIEAQFNFADRFYKNIALVGTKTGIGIIDTAGKFVVQPDYEYIKWIDNHTYVAQKNHSWAFYHIQSGKVLDLENGRVEKLGDSCYSFQENFKKGVFHLLQGRIISPIHDQIFKKNDVFFVKQNDKMGIVNEKDEMIIEPTYDSLFMVEQLIGIYHKKFYGLMNKKGKLILGANRDGINIIHDSLIELRDGQTYKLFNPQIARTIAENYISYDNFRKYVQVEFKNGEFSFIDLSGNKVFEENTNGQVKQLSTDIFAARFIHNAKMGLIDLNKGKFIMNPLYDDIDPLTDKYFIIHLSGNSGLISSSGEVIVEPGKCRFKFNGSEIFVYKDKGLEIFELDDKGNITEKIRHDNFKSLRIHSNFLFDVRRNVNPNASINASGIDLQINDTLFWAKGIHGRWGVFNVKADSFMMPPHLINLAKYDSLGVSLVSYSDKKNPIAWGEGPIFKIDEFIKVFDHKTAKMKNKLTFIMIFMNDFLVDNLPLARVILNNGKYGLIDRNFNLVKQDYVYIAPFSDGFAQCTQKGIIKKVAKSTIPYCLSDVNFYDIQYLYLYRRNFLGGFPTNEAIDISNPEWSYIDTLGNIVLSKLNYEHIEPFYHGKARVYKNKKWAVIDKTNSFFIPFVYDKIEYINNSDHKLFELQRNKISYGCINTQASLVSKIVYDKILTVQDGLFAVRFNGKWGFVDTMSKLQIPLIYNAVHSFSEGLVAISKGGKWGFLTKEGKLQIPFLYQNVTDFNEGVATVQKESGKVSVINREGNQLFEVEALQNFTFKNGFAIVKTKNGLGILNLMGHWTSKPNLVYDKIEHSSSSGLFIAKNAQGYQIIEQSGNQLSKTYDRIENFVQGYARVMKRTNEGQFFGLINTEGKECIAAQYTGLSQVSENRIIYKDKDNRCGAMNCNGHVLIAAQFFKMSDFKGGKSIIYSEPSKSGIIDSLGQILVTIGSNKIKSLDQEVFSSQIGYDDYIIQHEEVGNISETKSYEKMGQWTQDIATMKKDEKWGIVNKFGVELLSGKFSEITPFVNGFARVRLDKLYGVVDLDGKKIIEDDFEELERVNFDIIKATKGNLTHYFNMKGETIWQNN